jgi:hypothetical protein
MDAAYAAVYGFHGFIRPMKFLRRIPFEYWPFATGLDYGSEPFRPADIVLGEELSIGRIAINSPGMWEFIGQLNPLAVLREYLNDRWNRIKDRDYRNRSEQEKLRLENELLRQQVRREELGIVREEIMILRDLGIDEETLQRIVWNKFGRRLARLGRHQDSGLIGGPGQG